ncbi:hypothetical protein [Marinilabilia sp.]
MKNIISTLIIFSFFLASVNAQEKAVKVIDDTFFCKRRTQHMKPFSVVKGDVLEIKVKSQHRRRTIDLKIDQFPGNLTVFNYQELGEGTYEIVVPSDAVYLISYGGKRLDFDITVTKHTEKPNGPGRDFVFVKKPDTVHASGYGQLTLGHNYTLKPVKKRVKLNTRKETETIVNYDFLTGQDILSVNIMGDRKVPYQDKKLLSWSLSLTCFSTGVHNAMMSVVDEGIDTFVKVPEIGGSKKNKKIDKGQPENTYKYTDNLEKEKSDRLQQSAELISLGAEAAQIMAPNDETEDVAKAVAFVMDGGEMKDVVIDEGLDAVGASDDVKALMGKVRSFPSVNDLLKDGARKIIPKIDGKAKLVVNEKRRKVTYKSDEEIAKAKKLARLTGTRLTYEDLILSEQKVQTNEIEKSGGFITETFKVSNEGEKCLPGNNAVQAVIGIGKNPLEAKAKLMIDATYEITTYTDIIAYEREESPVYYDEFQTAYKVYYTYDIIFKDQMEDYYEQINFDNFVDNQGDRDPEPDEDIDILDKIRLSRFDRLN